MLGWPQEMKDKQFYAFLLISIVLVGIMSLSFAFSINSVLTISNTVSILPYVMAKSGSARDIQAAVDQVVAAGGIGEVHIPSGTFSFVNAGDPWLTVNVPAGVKLFGALTERDAHGQVITWKTVLTMPSEAPTGSIWFHFTGVGENQHSDTNKSIRVSDIEMIGYRYAHNDSTAMYYAIVIDRIANFRIDHCYFQDISGSAIWIGWDTYYHNKDENNGVIDHSVLNNTYGDPGFMTYPNNTLGYGIGIRRWASDLWDYNLSNIWGQYTNYTIVIEDNYFSKWRHSISFNDGMHGIVRFNLFDACYGISDVDGHGSYADSSGPAQHAVGTRSVEVYNNTFQNPDTRWNSQPWALNIRGGSWLVFNNTLIGYNEGGNSGLLDFNNDWGNYAPMSPECAVNQTYVWNNDLGGAGIIHYNADSIENVNYFLRAPSIQLDGLAYTPYQYPDPLTG